MRARPHRLLRLWELLVAAVVTFAAVEIPMRLVLHYAPPAWLTAADAVLTVVLVADVVVQWRGSPRSWRCLDLLAAAPLLLLAGGTAWPLLQVLKLARVANWMKEVRHHEVRHANLLRLVFFVYWMLLVAHALACGWLALDGRTQLAGEPGAPSDPATRYLRALYWCVTTLATVGYGDITPSGNAQVVYTMVVMLLGVGIYGYIIGNIASVLANIDLAKRHYQENMERLGAFLRYRNLPVALQRRLRDYYAYLWDNRMGYDETAVLADLPDSLRMEVIVNLRRDFIERTPLFQGASHELVREMAMVLRPMVFTPGDYVFQAGQVGHNMYFISRGTVEIIAPDGKAVLTTLKDGEFFGEIALLMDQPRSATVRAVEYCDVYQLDKETFDRVLARYPEFASHIKNQATRRHSSASPA